MAEKGHGGAGGKIFSATMKRAKRVTEKVCSVLITCAYTCMYARVWVCELSRSIGLEPASSRMCALTCDLSTSVEEHVDDMRTCACEELVVPNFYSVLRHSNRAS